MLGSHLVTSSQSNYANVWSTTRLKAKAGGRSLYLDLGEVKTVSFPDCIATAVICAGVTSVDRCRNDPSGTRLINVENTVALARQLVDTGIFTIFLSSNMVFDGNQPFPKPTDVTCPTTEYGSQKVEAENALLELGDSISVVRFSKIVSLKMPLLQKWATDLMENRSIHPFYDAVMAPVPISFAIEIIHGVAARKIAGITQASANTDISYERFAMYLAEKLKADSRLIAAISYKEAGINHMPSYTTLNSDRLGYLGLQSPAPLESIDSTSWVYRC